MQDFVHEELDVYKAALAFLHRPQRCLGCRGFSAAEKARFYRMARRSATECAAILDVYRARQSVGDAAIAAGRELLLRIIAMLTRMVINCAREEDK